MKQKVLIITDSDLDGCGSCLVLRWIHKQAHITQAAIDRGDAKNTITKYDIARYDKVYITDTYIPDDCKELVDFANVYIVDHHKTHYDERGKYTKAKILMKEYYSSCTRLLYDIFSSKIEFTKEQKSLITLIDDYDCFKLKFSQTLGLNAVYQEARGTRQEKLDVFTNEFSNGFSGFTQLQKNIIELRKKRLVETIQNLELFKGTIDGYNAICTFGKYFNNEIALYILNKFQVPICVIVMPEIGRVSFRRGKNQTVNLLSICEKYCDGIGHEYAAGGKLTDKFLELTKTFSAIK